MALSGIRGQKKSTTTFSKCRRNINKIYPLLLIFRNILRKSIQVMFFINDKGKMLLWVYQSEGCELIIKRPYGLFFPIFMKYLDVIEVQ